MKKLLLLPLLGLCSISSNGQDNKESEPTSKSPDKWRGWTINPYLFGGTAVSSIKFAGELDKTGGSAVLGCLVGYNLNSHVSFNSGLAFSAYIWQKDLGNNALYIDNIQSSSSFLQIPLLAKITTSKYQKVGFMVETGFNFNFLTSVEDRIVYTVGQDDVSSDDTYSTRFCPTFSLMLGLRIPVSKSTWIDAGFDTYTFLTNQYTDISGKTTGTGIKIGVQTKISK